MKQRFMFFRNGVGSATCDDVTVHFKTCPRLPGMRFVEIEYMPRVKSRMISEEDPDHWRDMSDLECLIADKALARMRDSAAQVFA
jgi:hypothetical protein